MPRIDVQVSRPPGLGYPPPTPRAPRARAAAWATPAGSEILAST